MTRATDGFTGKRVTVMGLGRFGGGAGVTRWLAAQGTHVLLTDLEPASKLEKPLAVVADLIESGAVALRLGEHREEDFAHADLVVANPAVPQPWRNPYLLAAQNAGVPITTEIRLTVERLNRQRVIGVTGTAGKSTTAAMIHHVLNRVDGCMAHLGGNIGGSLLGTHDSIADDDWIVLELSSAMLYWLGDVDRFRGWSPRIALLTNLSPNHLDWHGSFEHYERSKENIIRYQQEGDHAITRPLRNVFVPLPIPGEHNQINAHFALAAVECATGVPAEGAADLLADFRGLPHRLQLVAEYDGMRFYNDSKSTTPEATALAVAAFDNPAAIHLIAGGYDKKIDLSPIAELSHDLAGTYTIGATGRALAAAATNAQYCETLEAAVHSAQSHMKPGDVLLLSPGCASWDQFTNYEERGESFTYLVMFSRDAKRSAARFPSGRG